MRQVFHPLPWFYPEDNHRLKELYHKHGHTVEYKKGTILKSGGQSRKHFHLAQGLCSYFINYAEGKPRSFALILPGASMGDITCITNERVNVTTRVMRDSKILVVPPDLLVKEMSKDAKLAIEVNIHMMHKQESSLEATIANFTYEPPMRLKIFMKAMLVRFNGGMNEWNKLPLIFTNEEFGMMVDSTRVTINRILSTWQKDGLIKKEGKQIIAHESLFADIYDWHDYMD